jgi:Putative Actinobacterial Holin-X, holin superfamily III
MATPSRLDDAPTPARHETPTRHESLVTRLVRLGALELELGWAETRNLVIRVAIAVAVAVPALIALLASIIVIVAGALAPLFDTPWEHLVIAGGTIAVLALAALAWSAWRLTHIAWPQQTLASMQEAWRWLVAQLRSKLTSR